MAQRKDGKFSFALSSWADLGITGGPTTGPQPELCRAASQVLWTELCHPKIHILGNADCYPIKASFLKMCLVTY